MLFYSGNSENYFPSVILKLYYYFPQSSVKQSQDHFGEIVFTIALMNIHFV